MTISKMYGTAVDLEYYKDVRKEFTTQEWIDIILGAVDYKAEGYVAAKAENAELPDPTDYETYDAVTCASICRKASQSY